MACDPRVTLGPLVLRNPVLTASGTFGYGLEFEPYFDVASLGGICTKGLSLLPRVGNPPPRLCETASGMLNAIGLANVGVDAFCADKLPHLRARGITVIANLFATRSRTSPPSHDASRARRESPPSRSTSRAPTWTRGASRSAWTRSWPRR